MLDEAWECVGVVLICREGAGEATGSCLQFHRWTCLVVGISQLVSKV